MQPVLHTERLVLSPRTLADLEPCVAMDLDPAVNLYLPGLRNRSPESHRKSENQRIASNWPSLGGIWVVREKGKNTFLGWCGLFPLEKTDSIQIGYRYIPTSWRRGVATEAARAVLHYGFEDLALELIKAVVHPDNTASLRVIGKLQMRQAGPGVYYGHEVHVFELTRSEYRKRHA